MRFLILALLIVGVRSEEWDAENYPNPTTSQFQQCHMKSRANICDPDGVLTEAARYRLDHDLKQLEARTRQENGATFCDKKGVTAAMAIARHVKGGSADAVKHMANDMLRKWTLDAQCQKAIVIVVSTDDMKFWVARDDRVPVYADEFTDIFMQQKKLFQQSNYQEALTGVLRGTTEKALSKQGSPIQSPGAPRPGFDYDDMSRDRRPGPRGGPGGGMKMPSIPGWVWLALILGVIPLLCCCLCCYLCFCRGKGGHTASAGTPYQDDGTRGGGTRPAAGGRSGFSNLITSMGGAGIGSLIGNMISGRNRGGGGMYGPAGGGGGGGFSAGGGGGRGMGYDRTPAYDDNQGRGGHGLYPSAVRKDEGGGGGW